MMKIVTIAHVPEELGNAWLQHLRDFDTKHVGRCHFEVVGDAPNVSLHEIVEMMRVDPALSVTQVLERKRTR